MKKIYIAFTVISLLLIVSCSHYTPIDDNRIIIGRFGADNYDTGMATRIADTSSLEARIELSTHVIKGKICAVSNIILTDTHELNFTYEVEVKDIYLNVGNQLNINDKILVSSTEGIIPASIALEKFGRDMYINKIGMFDRRDFNDNEYVVSSNYNAIPLEIGNEYIILLNDSYLETEQVFAESGYSYMYEIRDGYAISGVNRDKIETESEVIDMLVDQIEKRTGRADVIGYFSYISELGEKQRNNN